MDSSNIIHDSTANLSSGVANLSIKTDSVHLDSSISNFVQLKNSSISKTPSRKNKNKKSVSNFDGSVKENQSVLKEHSTPCRTETVQETEISNTPKSISSGPIEPKSILKGRKKTLVRKPRPDTIDQPNAAAAAAAFSFRVNKVLHDNSLFEEGGGQSKSIKFRSSTPKSAADGNSSGSRENSQKAGGYRLDKIRGVVKTAVMSCYKVNLQWQKCKSTGGKQLKAIVSCKVDSMGNVTRHLNFEAVQNMADFSDTMKAMRSIVGDLSAYSATIHNLKVGSDDFQTIKPYNTLALITILEILETLAKNYRTEYKFKEEKCKQLMSVCTHGEEVDDIQDMLDNLVTVWYTDVHIKDADDGLIGLMHDVGGWKV